MKMRRTFCVFLAVLLLTGCGAKSLTEEGIVQDSADAAMPQEEWDYESAGSANEAGGEKSAVSVTNGGGEERKLIRRFDLSIETKEFDAVLEDVQKKMEESGGYIERSSLDSGSAYYSDYCRYASLTVRIPDGEAEDFVAHLRETANVTAVSESAEDITLQYVDTESRIKALETEETRLLEILEQAETVEEVIAIESRLSEVRYELEAYTSQLRTFDNRIDYSTVEIRIQEVEREVRTESKGFWDQVGERFRTNVYRMGRGAKELAVTFLGSTPYLLAAVVLIGAVVLIVRAVSKRKKKKRERAEELSKKE